MNSLTCWQLRRPGILFDLLNCHIFHLDLAFLNLTTSHPSPLRVSTFVSPDNGHVGILSTAFYCSNRDLLIEHRAWHRFVEINTPTRKSRFLTTSRVTTAQPSSLAPNLLGASYNSKAAVTGSQLGETSGFALRPRFSGLSCVTFCAVSGRLER